MLKPMKITGLGLDLFSHPVCFGLKCIWCCLEHFLFGFQNARLQFSKMTQMISNELQAGLEAEDWRTSAPNLRLIHTAAVEMSFLTDRMRNLVI